MIITKDGKSYSVRTEGEQKEILQSDLDQLSSEELETLKILLAELKGDVPVTEHPPLMEVLARAEYVREPVDMRTFVLDPYYLGHTCDVLYPTWLEDLEELFKGDYHEVIFTGSIGSGKCLKSNNFFVEGATGERITIAEAAERDQNIVPSLQGSEIVYTPASRVWKSGRKLCARMELISGHWLEASLDHPVLTPEGYQPLGLLKLGDFVATARNYPQPRSLVTSFSDAEVIVAAGLVADGSLTGFTTIYCKGDPELIRLYKENVVKLPGGEITNEKFDRGAFYVHTPGLKEWTSRLGIRCLSKEKKVPSTVFGLSDEQLALFLRWILADGYVAPNGIELTLASESLIDDVQLLLLRFGVLSRKAYHQASIKDELYDSWRLTITGADNVALFAERVGAPVGKDASMAKLLDKAKNTKSNTNVDLVPITIEELKEIRRETGPHANRDWGRVGSLAKGSFMSRAKFERLCHAVSYKGRFKKFAEMGVVWGRVKSLEMLGEHDVYDLTVPETENVVINSGIIAHNTFAASIGVCRILYELSCLKDPQQTFGLARDSNLSVICVSVNEILATKVAFENIATKIKASPYFKENFQFEPTKKELRFPHNIWVAARASTDTSALGLNPISAIMDEINFLPRSSKKTAIGNTALTHFDHAETMYNAIKRRMKSRFEKCGSRLPGKLFIVSSKRTRTDFTSRLIAESKSDPHVFVSDRSLWDVRPDYYSEERFHVLCGNEQTPSRIIDGEEDIESIKNNLPDGAVLIPVPVDFRRDFERDLENSIRDIAGIATVAISPYIQRREKILEAIDARNSHPFTVQIYDRSMRGDFIWSQMVHEVEESEQGRVRRVLRPKINPGAVRHIHLDQSKSGDATGFCMAHIGGFKGVERRTGDGRRYIENAPFYVVDIILRIVAAIGDEIVLGDLRQMVYDLSTHGYIITSVSMDSWNSVDACQQLSAKGYNAQLVSVDKTVAPYDNLKMALYENRVFYYQYTPLIEELQQLEYDRNKNKVDHPPRGKKDLADALAGTLYTLSQLRMYQPLPILRGISYDDGDWQYADPVMPVAAETPEYGSDMVSPEFGQHLPPFLGGGGDDWDGGI